MACSCHGRDGAAVIRISPFDQCTACAKKHIVKAWSLWNEFLYADDNRDSISGQLRLAVDHLMYDHRDIALKARDLAVLIEENRDVESGDRWDELLRQIRDAYRADHPDHAGRLKQLAMET